MGLIQDLATAFERALAERLRAAQATVEEVAAYRPDRWVELLHDTFRELGRESGLEVAPLRRGIGELGWELVWGKNLLLDYARLSASAPAELFDITLVLEIAEGSLRAGSKPERSVEEVANDLGKLTWARAPLKVLAFGARREAEVASSIAALEAGLAGVIAARDAESDYLLVGLPNLQGTRTVEPARGALWLKTIAHGKPDAARERPFAELLRS